MTAVITIGIGPEIQLGPVTLAWHGITIAFGILIGGVAAGRSVKGPITLVDQGRQPVRPQSPQARRTVPLRRLDQQAVLC